MGNVEEVSRLLALHESQAQRLEADRKHLLDLLIACSNRFISESDFEGARLVVDGLKALPSLQGALT